jgi:hypothetical protein
MKMAIFWVVGLVVWWKFTKVSKMLVASIIRELILEGLIMEEVSTVKRQLTYLTSTALHDATNTKNT